MIFTTQAITQHLKNVVEFTTSIEDVDDLHDAVVDSSVLCDTEFGYNQVCAMLPIIFEAIVDDIDCSEDVWGTYAMRETIGLCD